MFKRASTNYGNTPVSETPYHRARQVWDDRIGSARIQARNWRLMAFTSTLLTAGFAAALVWQSLHGTVVPWVVEVDQLGQPQAVAPASAAFTPSDAQIAYHLRQFITDVRSIPADPIVVRQNWLQAYDFATAKGAQALNGYAQTNDPFALIGQKSVAVDITTVIRASSDSFRITWVEKGFTAGQLVSTEHWSAIVTIVVAPPRDADHLTKNPLGIYVDAINWSKELSQS